MKDLLNKEIELPKIGDQVLRDGYLFTVNEVRPHRDLAIVATIILRGQGGGAEIGYYDYLLHEKVKRIEIKYLITNGSYSVVEYGDETILEQDSKCNRPTAMFNTREEAQKVADQYKDECINLIVCPVRCSITH